jgi:hypothetical protein
LQSMLTKFWMQLIKADRALRLIINLLQYRAEHDCSGREPSNAEESPELKLRIRQALVLSFEKKQWPSVRGIGVDDFADDDGMIAAVVALSNFALDIAERRIENRCPVLAWMPLQAGKLINALGRKTTRHIFLMFTEKVDRETVLQIEARIALRAFVNADQDQRRIQ